MSAAPQMSTASVPRPSRSFMEFVTSPAVDRVVAIIAVTPFAYRSYLRLTSGAITIPLAAVSIQTLVLVATMVFRRPPRRVTPNPWYWLLAFVATYGTLIASAFVTRGPELAPTTVTTVVSVAAMAFMILARFNLGRSIGFVPAERVLVSAGAYRLVRHPIYSALFLAYVANILRSYSVLNLSMYGTLMALFMIKSLAEEDFLRQNPAYERYMQTVRHRWIPGLL